MFPNRSRGRRSLLKNENLGRVHDGQLAATYDVPCGRGFAESVRDRKKSNFDFSGDAAVGFGADVGPGSAYDQAATALIASTDVSTQLSRVLASTSAGGGYALGCWVSERLSLRFGNKTRGRLVAISLVQAGVTAIVILTGGS